MDRYIKYDKTKVLAQYIDVYKRQVLDCTITNNSTEPIALTKIVIVNGDGKTIYGKQYDNQTPQIREREQVLSIVSLLTGHFTLSLTRNLFQKWKH